MNATMRDLKRAFESAGFKDVKTVRSSGNVVFTAPSSSETALQRKAEQAMKRELGHSFLTIIRSIDMLRRMLTDDPYRSFRLAPGVKRVVTFLRDSPAQKVKLPVELNGARILAMKDREIFTSYERNRETPDFMVLIEKTFGKDVTTRTWETVAMVAR